MVRVLDRTLLWYIVHDILNTYKDALHFGKDGFFQAGQHDKKMDHKDPSLTNGAAYFVDNEEYE